MLKLTSDLFILFFDASRLQGLLQSVQGPYGGGEEAVFETGCFSGQGSIATPVGHQLEQVVSRVRRVRDYFICLFDSAFDI